MSKDPDSKITSNPSIKKLLDQVESFEALSKLSPLMKLLGKGGRDAAELLSKVPELAERTRKFTEMPDRFNTHFAELGWIAYDSLNTDMAFEAIALADDGRIKDAENRIVDFYDSKNLDILLRSMYGIREYRVRERLANLAKVDYLAGRYHASVPLVLMLIDGIVNDIDKERGLFAEGVDVTAWDSIAAHSSGLSRLAELLRSKRGKTNDKPLTLPYRNGIMHGRDLAYDNKLVAAKTWAALFAVGDWARAYRQTPKEDEEPSIWESLKHMAQLQDERKILDAWKPRKLEVGEDIPESGEPDEYEAGTPERCLVEYLTCWKKKNYGKMAEMTCELFRRDSVNKRAGSLARQMKGKSVQRFRILGTEDTTPAITFVDVQVEYELEGKLVSKDLQFRIRYETESGDAKCRGIEGATWRIVSGVFGA